jgi:hypothetical protein
MAIFVIQDHHAKRAGRHYDLRIEWSGNLEEYAKKRDFNATNEPPPGESSSVLRSWAIPKHRLPGPGERLLAQATEDHSMGYYKYVGPGEKQTIPEGSYGAGDMFLVARGEYELESVSENGTIHINLGTSVEYTQDGIELGRFVLVPFKGAGRNAYLIMRASDTSKGASPSKSAKKGKATPLGGECPI